MKTQVTVTSRLDASPAEVWGSIASAEGVNYEMNPWLDFTAPEGIDLFQAAARGEVLNLKVKGPLGLPLGHYPLQIKEMEEGRGFLEQTRMLPFLLWHHERTIEADSGSTRITDQLGWDWKPSFLDPVFRLGVKLFFNHRHRRLKKRFGSVAPG